MAMIDLIAEDVVKVPLQATLKTEVITELVDILVAAGRLTDREGAIAALLERESRGSTGLENGVAVPHAKIETISNISIAIGIAPRGIPFDALDGKPSQLFFLMLARPDQSAQHIEALSEIARMVRSTAFLRAMIASASPREVVEMIRE